MHGGPKVSALQVGKAELPNRDGSSRGLPAGASEGWGGTRACRKGALRAPAGRGAGGGALEWLHAAHVDVTSRQGALPPHATRVLDSARGAVLRAALPQPGAPGRRSGRPPPWCRPAGSAPPAGGSRPPTAPVRAWHPCLGTAAGRGGGNHGNGYSASLPALQPRTVLVAAEARSLPPPSPHMR